MKSNPFIFDDHLHPTDQVGVRWFQSLVFNHVAPCFALPTAHLPGGHKVYLKTSDFYVVKNKLIWMIISFEAKDDVFFQVRTILPRACGGCWRGPPVRFFLHWSYIFETKSSDYDWVIPEDDIFKPRANIMIEQHQKMNLKYIPRSIWRGCSMSTSCQALPSAQVKITNNLWKDSPVFPCFKRQSHLLSF